MYVYDCNINIEFQFAIVTITLTVLDVDSTDADGCGIKLGTVTLSLVAVQGLLSNPSHPPPLSSSIFGRELGIPSWEPRSDAKLIVVKLRVDAC